MTINVYVIEVTAPASGLRAYGDVVCLNTNTTENELQFDKLQITVSRSYYCAHHSKQSQTRKERRRFQHIAHEIYFRAFMTICNKMVQNKKE